MKGYALLALTCASALFLMGSVRERMPVIVLPSTFVSSFDAHGHTLLFEENGVSVMRREDALDDDFRDLYIVRMPGKTQLPFFVEGLGSVLHFETGQFALVKIDALYKVETLSHLMHHEGIACGALMRLQGDEMVKDVPAGAGEPVVPVSEDLASVRGMVASVSADNIRAMISELSGINTRFHSSPSGLRVPELLKSKYEALASGRPDVSVELFDHQGRTSQDSIVVRIQGATKPDEIVVLGSHIDSVNWSDGSSSRSPGADDNASGTSTNFEVFRILMESGVRPERTIEIHGYAAEEVGLVGSQDMAQRYKSTGKNVVTMVQHDMNLYKAPGSPDKIWFVTNNTFDQFNSSLGSLVDRYVGVQWAKKSLSGGDSDHSSWRRQGFVTAFPFEDPAGYNRQIHTSRDSLETANAMTQAAAFAKLGLAYLGHYAGF